MKLTATRHALTQKVKSQNLKTLKEGYAFLRHKHRRTAPESTVLILLADEIESRIGESAFDSFLDTLDAAAAA